MKESQHKFVKSLQTTERKPQKEMVEKKLNCSSSNTGLQILASLQNNVSLGLRTTKEFHRKDIDLAVLSDCPRSKAACCF